MPIFKIENLSFSVTKKKVLKNISFTANENEWISISGPSGSGKSSLLKILATLESYEEGNIYYQGENLAAVNPITYRQEVAYCFQQPVLFGSTVRDNLSFPFLIRQLDFNEEKAVEKLKAVNLDHSFLNQPIQELSGGEKQRIALIRSLLFSPRVLLLDEVTTGLDAENKAIVRELIKKAHQDGTTIFEVTHDADEILKASRILNLVKGELIV